MHARPCCPHRGAQGGGGPARSPVTPHALRPARVPTHVRTQAQARAHAHARAGVSG